MSRWLSLLAKRWQAGGIAAGASMLAVALGYVVPTTMELDLGASFPSGLTIDGFYDAEGGFRWSRASSEITFRDAGAANEAKLELELSGFRPPGASPPVVVLQGNGAPTRLSAERRFHVQSIVTPVRGWWSADLVARLRSETFTPGAGDERSLGVRVSRARLVLADGATPPLRQLLFTGIVVFLASALGRSARKSFIIATILGAVLASGYAWHRVLATTFVPVMAAIVLFYALVRWLSPGAVQFGADVVEASRRSLLRAIRRVLSPRGAALVVFAAVGLCGVFWMTPQIDLDLGSGNASPLLNRFGALDREGAITFRRAHSGATLDVSDFGTSSPWVVSVHASLERGTSSGIVVRVDDTFMRARLSNEWSTATQELDALGWARGNRRLLNFPGLGAGTSLRVDRILIDRGRSWPPLRVLLRISGAALLLAVALGSTISAGAIVFGLLIAVALEPVVTLPFLPTIVLAAAATLVVAITAKGLLETTATRGWSPALAPVVVSIAAIGFFLWFVVTASPRYVGGHYAFHSNIAKAISGGAFLQHFLPYPGSNLSRQPQWGNLIVPHSCLFHTVVAPAAWLSGKYFHLTTKLALAAFCFLTALMTALVATKLRDKLTGVYAAFACVFLPTSFQLLGLGHLMTLFGTLTATVALGYLALQADRLGERPVLLTAVGLVTLCFVSYTGALLFGSIAIASAWALSLRPAKLFAQRLAGIVVAAGIASFLLYYMYWAAPFLTETLPELLTRGASADGIDLWARIRSQPAKLAYTFGSSWVPVAGLAGLVGLVWAKETPMEPRNIVWGWAAILPGFAVLDLGFNFLLKHHYFAYPVIALGVAVALGWLHSKGRLGAAGAVLLACGIAALGLTHALSVAQGGT